MKHVLVYIKCILDNHEKFHGTCSGVSSNNLPPIVKETEGMESRLAQSTEDSPMGLGSRSHSCKATQNMIIIAYA